MDITTRTFRENARRALDDAPLQRALARAMRQAETVAVASAAERADWEALRARARAMKEETIGRLDRHLARFADQVAARGGTVHWARDAAEARRIVVGLARDRGVTLAVKGKSMATEEVGLNAALEDAGIRPVEGDLGEYIVQLAGQPPSHITTPAIHLARGEIADLFQRTLGVARNDDPDALCRVARETLHGLFRAATMGLTGANFAVAETGTIVLHENEGNIRLATTLPRVHVAILGIEKVVPTLADLATVMRLLPRASTGQRLTSYVSWITGPRRADEDDGPEELHVVLLDNGRTRILADPVAREALYCIRCGACLNCCPVYRVLGGHAYGWILPGPIGSILTPQLLGLGRAPDLPFASTLCGACRDACPVRIDIPGLLLHLRHRIAEERTTAAGAPPAPADTLRSRLARLAASAAARAMSHPGLFALAGRAGRHVLQQFASGGTVRRLPPPLDAWTDCRDFPLPAEESFRSWWEAHGNDDAEMDTREG